MQIDIIFLVLIALACFKGLRRGLIMAIFSMLGFFIGLAVALKFSAFAATKISVYTGDAKWLPFISFVVVLIAVNIIVRLAGRLIEKSFQVVMLGWANRLAGALLYVFMYSIVYSIFLFYAVQIHFIKPETISSSIVYPYLQPLGPAIIGSLGTVIPWFKNTIGELEKFFSLFSISPQ